MVHCDFRWWRQRRRGPVRGDHSDRGSALTAMVLLSTFAASCAAASKNLPPIAAEGERTSFSSTVGRVPCGDSLELTDRRVIELMTELEHPLGHRERITYYWLPGRMDLSPCPEGTDCAEGRVVYSRTMFHDHEIVHALLSDLGKRQTFLYEGMAGAFGRAGGKLTVERRHAKSEILNSLSEDVDPATISYPLAGWFVRFLIETYGMKAVKRLYSQAQLGSDTDELRRLFEDELGIALDEVLDQLVEEAPDCYPRDNLCVAKPVPWDDGVWQHRFGLDCDSLGVLEIVPGALRNESLLEIDEPGRYLISVSKPSTPVEPVVIARCACEAEHHLIEGGSEAIVELNSGLYRVLAGRFADDVTACVDPVEVTIQALPAGSD